MAKGKRSFCLEGRFDGFAAGSKSPFKYLRLTSSQDEHVVKLSKSLRLMLFRYLQVGDLIRVVGAESTDKDTGEPKFKALEVVRISALTGQPPVHQAKASKVGRQRAKVLVCQKSACRKRGATQICQGIEAALAARGLTDAVQVKLTGCMDKCKAGPHVVVMPDKQRYARVKPGQVENLIEQHFVQNNVAEVLPG
ncbi:MAG: (2Fe-2S) ferredoxin domain-containing protein [Moorea sp. SIO3C2]|nr:(2Fe-2S) ferredoxin domain-containing protein [Moorena sp. SIO3C2]